MKPSLLSILACPFCSGELSLTSTKENSVVNEIVDGTLRCSACFVCYPIVEGIPRFVPNTHSNVEHAFEKIHGKTQERFSFEWMNYPGALPEDREVFLRETQIPENEWQDRKVLDAGCGMGRYSRVAHSCGAEVVAMDIGTALVRLKELAESSPRMHIVQGDLMHPPFKKNVFDIIYSIGVIHHTPSAKKTFEQLADLVKPDGLLTVWVYGMAGSYKNFRTNPLQENRLALDQIRFLVWLVVLVRGWISDTLRVFTVHIPHKILYAFCFVLAWIGAIPFIKYLTFSAHPEWRVRLQENFDWLTPPYQSHHTKEEIRSWFEKCGYEVLQILPHGFVPKPGILGRKKK